MGITFDLEELSGSFLRYLKDIFKCYKSSIGFNHPKPTENTKKFFSTEKCRLFLRIFSSLINFFGIFCWFSIKIVFHKVVAFFIGFQIRYKGAIVLLDQKLRIF